MELKNNMNEWAKKWVEALRSGKYLQGKGYLAQQDDSGEYRYCCLGVACEILREELNLEISGKGRQKEYHYNSYSLLPKIVAVVSNLNTQEGGFRDKNGNEICLTSLNDDTKKTFAEIADIIESQPKGLFRE